MKVLIVEDDVNKSKQIRDFVQECIPSSFIHEARSYSGGLRTLLNEVPDLIVLDMSMPTFDVTPQDKGGRIRGFGGRDLLDEIARRRLPGRVIVVTQFETFGEGEQRKSLEEIKNELSKAYPLSYAGSVYYHPAQSDWKRELLQLIQGTSRKKPTNAIRADRRRRRKKGK